MIINNFELFLDRIIINICTLIRYFHVNLYAEYTVVLFEYWTNHTTYIEDF